MTRLSRRQTLGAAGAAGGALMVGCGARLAGLETTDAVQSADAASCVLTPAKTVGPYFVDELLNRKDIRSDPGTGTVSTGVPLSLTFKLQNQDDDCRPVTGATVDIWHCDSQGKYSDIASEGTSGKKFLRGYQFSDANGAATFATIFPGYYPGRAVHIHFKIRAGRKYDFTSQVFFDPAVSNPIQVGYRGTEADTQNNSDGIYGTDGAKLIPALSGNTASGYSGTLTVGLKGLGSSGASDVQASLGSADVKGRDSVKLRIDADEEVRLDAKLTQEGTVIGRKRAGGLSGRETVRMKLNGKARPGKASLKLTFTDGAGASGVVKKKLRIPR